MNAADVKCWGNFAKPTLRLAGCTNTRDYLIRLGPGGREMPFCAYCASEIRAGVEITSIRSAD